MSGRFTTLSGEVVKTTDRAVLFRDENDQEHWIPRSVCCDGDHIDEGDTDVNVGTWWGEREGLL